MLHFGSAQKQYFCQLPTKKHFGKFDYRLGVSENNMQIKKYWKDDGDGHHVHEGTAQRKVKEKRFREEKHTALCRATSDSQ